jgi:hypothetical protein
VSMNARNRLNGVSVNVPDIGKVLVAKLSKDRRNKHVSNGWIKYYELLSPLMVKDDKDKRAFFNAELPGSGIMALERLDQRRTYRWVASSLVPSEGTSALKDSYGLFRDNPSRWLMTPDNDGDCTKLPNVIDLAARAGAIDLYSHDAGMDISDNFDDEEFINLKLHVGCALVGFLCLNRGGKFVVKGFMSFTRLGRWLIKRYMDLFDSASLIKPTASRDRNDEYYLVGKGYRGLNVELEEVMKAILLGSVPDAQSLDAAPWPSPLTRVELSPISDFFVERIKHQVIAIDDIVRKRLPKDLERKADAWIVRYGLNK